MLGNRSIARRLVLVITIFSSVIFAVTLGYNYYSSRVLLRKELESNARNLALSLVNRVETELVAVAKVTEGTARAIEIGTFSEEDLLALVRATLQGNPGIYGSAVAFEPYAFRPETRLYAPYLYRDKGQIRLIRLEDSYRYVPYLYWDWYQIPRELGQLEWSEPFFDEGAGNILISTCSVPFYGNAGGTRRLKGIFTADISLDALTELVSSVRILETGYAALLSRNGALLAHPMKDAIMNESFFSIDEARNDAALRELRIGHIRLNREGLSPKRFDLPADRFCLLFFIEIGHTDIGATAPAPWRSRRRCRGKRLSPKLLSPGA